jgi:hypothetical protein
LSLVELEFSGAAAVSADAARYEIELPCGAHLRFGADFTDAELRRLIGLLREVW